MPRQLPEDPVRRRITYFRRIYQNMPHWREQIIAGTMTDVMTTPEGEEIYFNDLLVGLDTLPPRQRQAFELICLQGYTETAAAKVMLPNSRWSTTVQQHVNAALERMVARYDDQQSGLLALIKRWRALMALHPIIETKLKDALKEARKEIVDQIRPLQEALSQADQMLRNEPVIPAASTEEAPAADPDAEPERSE